MYVCMYACMYVCMYVCMSAMYPYIHFTNIYCERSCATWLTSLAQQARGSTSVVHGVMLKLTATHLNRFASGSRTPKVAQHWHSQTSGKKEQLYVELNLS